MSRRSSWYQPAITYEGVVTAEFGAPDQSISGPGIATFLDDGSQELSFQSEIDLSSRLGKLINGLTKCTALRVETHNGTLVSHDVNWARVEVLSKTVSFNFKSATFVPIETRKPRYFVVPLINYMGGYPDRLEQFKSNPLLLHPANAFCMPFELYGLSAFIQPLEYKLGASRRESIEKGNSRRDATAVIVCEHADIINNVSAFDVFQFGVLPVLGLATGTAIHVPWVEIRDHAGELVRREHVLWNGPDYQKGHRAIYESNGSLSELLRCAQGWNDFGKRDWALILRQTTQIGWTGVNSWEQMCQHACIVIDVLATQSGAKPKGVKYSDAMKSLLAKFQLHDFDVMGKYEEFDSLEGWSEAVRKLRNMVMHDAKQIDLLMDEAQMIRLIRHLHDIALRLVLCSFGYKGLYAPAVLGQLDLVRVDWVTDSTLPQEFGYPKPQIRKR
ncbi:MAG TPA: hypothetical protein VHI13_10345 [Candidatus Kapabacteria bacterium]|nr:hypothetical protein [Candidatus Kapabacteria bacterium]